MQFSSVQFNTRPRFYTIARAHVFFFPTQKGLLCHWQAVLPRLTPDCFKINAKLRHQRTVAVYVFCLVWIEDITRTRRATRAENNAKSIHYGGPVPFLDNSSHPQIKKLRSAKNTCFRATCIEGGFYLWHCACDKQNPKRKKKKKRFQTKKLPISSNYSSNSPSRLTCIHGSETQNQSKSNMYMYKKSILNIYLTRGESRVADESRKSCALGCGRALLWTGTPCQLPAQRWELAVKTQRQSSIKSSAIVNSCQSL